MTQPALCIPFVPGDTGLPIATALEQIQLYVCALKLSCANRLPWSYPLQIEYFKCLASFQNWGTLLGWPQQQLDPRLHAPMHLSKMVSVYSILPNVFQGFSNMK